MQAKANESERSTQAKERTRLKRERDRRCGDKGANSTASMMFEEKGRPTDRPTDRPTGEKPEKSIIERDTRRSDTDRLTFAARVHVIQPISYVL